jgi:glutamate synthase (NADPH/NADH) large chain
MVDLDPINEEDAQLLQTLISKHFAYTQSTVAQFILADFDNQLSNFVKVYPRDFKKVMEKKKTIAVK